MALLTSKLTSAWLLIIGVLFHVTYIFSIFDIYFTSPLVHGMEQHRVEAPAPAKRLVLFVADGLRADKLYQLHPDSETGVPATKAPFLRHVIEKEGSWGVSHTRVPTESRPGHVAIIAGFYEDVSAVTKGWQMNPVNFDSVFNQSEHTWSFGSPDILPMFAHGASDPARIDTIMYPAEHEDFGKGDASVLDTWVFDKFTDLLERSKTDPELYKKLHSDKIVFFLHLLGLDTNGHSHLPSSDLYINNIKIVDDGIKKVTEQLREFYNDDGKTSFVFTADHGMGNRGAHGDGHPDNTRTPIIAWGAGIQGPDTTNPHGHDEFSADWQLNAYSRNDVKQADIAPLMTSLIGVNYPVNSVGELPLSYLDATESFRAQSTFANTLQILEQYHVKQEQKRRTELLFKPYPGLTGDHSPEAVKKQVEALIQAGQYREAEIECTLVRDLCLEGLRYLQTYDWLFLRSVVSSGYLGWIVFSMNFILRTFVTSNESRGLGASRVPRTTRHVASAAEQKLINTLAFIVFAIFSAILSIKQSPALYYVYVAFPVFFWSRVALDRRELLAAIAKATRAHGWIKPLGAVVGYIIALEILVYSYFNRGVLSVCFFFLALWPFFLPAAVQRNITLLMVSWSLSCLGTSVFTLLPVEMGESQLLIFAGGIVLTLSGAVAVWIVPSITLPVGSAEAQAKSAATARYVMMFQTGMIALSTVIVNSTVRSLAAQEGLPLLNQIVSWIILVVTASIPFVYGARSSQHYLLRMVVIYLSFAPIFLLLSTSYEPIFYFFLASTLLSWLMLERKIYSASEMQPLSDALFTEKRTGNASSSTTSTAAASSSVTGANLSTAYVEYPTRSLGPKDARPAIFFLFFINVAFFGTGNVASLASFSLQSVFRLTTVFNPFFMGSLLIFKILIPFFLVSSVFRVLGRSLDLPPFSLFLLGLATTDVMTLNFFYLVRDDGSWLEIGTSISHFCISSLMVLFTILLFALSDLLVGHVLVPVVSEGQRKKRT